MIIGRYINYARSANCVLQFIHLTLSLVLVLFSALSMYNTVWLKSLRTDFIKTVWVALSMCDKWEHVDRSLPNEDTKFQYCTIKHRVASKSFRMDSFHQLSWKHIVSSGWQSSFVLKMNWWLQKYSKCCQKSMVTNVYLVWMFSNGTVNFAMSERTWMMIREWGAPKPAEHHKAEFTSRECAWRI